MDAEGCKISVIVEARGCPGRAALEKAVRTTLEMEGARGVSVNMLFTDNAGIRRLNKRFLHRDRPTDVIAFPATRLRRIDRSQKGFIGEIVVSAEMARLNSRRYGNSPDTELFLYIIHGILHLLGYDDEEKKRRLTMRKRQEKILNRICTSL
jgi:probable rRNA maturation factor